MNFNLDLTIIRMQQKLHFFALYFIDIYFSSFSPLYIFHKQDNVIYQLSMENRTFPHKDKYLLAFIDIYLR